MDEQEECILGVLVMGHDENNARNAYCQSHYILLAFASAQTPLVLCQHKHSPARLQAKFRLTELCSYNLNFTVFTHLSSISLLVHSEEDDVSKDKTGLAETEKPQGLVSGKKTNFVISPETSVRL